MIPKKEEIEKKDLPRAVAARLNGLSTKASIDMDRLSGRKVGAVICPYCGLVSTISVETVYSRVYDCECGAPVFIEEIL